AARLARSPAPTRAPARSWWSASASPRRWGPPRAAPAPPAYPRSSRTRDRCAAVRLDEKPCVLDFVRDARPIVKPLPPPSASRPARLAARVVARDRGGAAREELRGGGGQQPQPHSGRRPAALRRR